MSTFQERYEEIKERLISLRVEAHLKKAVLLSSTKEDYNGREKLISMHDDAEKLLKDLYKSKDLPTDEKMDLVDKVTRLNRTIRSNLFLLRE